MENKEFQESLGKAWSLWYHQSITLLKNRWIQVVLLVFALYLFGRSDIKINFPREAHSANIIENGLMYGTPFGIKDQHKKTTNTNNIKSSTSENKSLKNKSKVWWDEVKDKSASLKNQMNLANEATAVGAALNEEEKALAARLSNLSVVFNSDKYFKDKNISQAVVDMKLNTCKVYIEKFSKTAQEEAEIFNIPASITLAQGLLESNAGHSQLALKENNHFGIKCKSKCLGCRCANYTDDNKYDMFRIFDSAWYSYREHSKLLMGKRYRYLSKLDRSDYKNWAKGLKSSGYATDKKYAEKLIKIIEFFKLDRFDK